MIRFVTCLVVALWTSVASASISLTLPEEVNQEWEAAVMMGTIVASITGDPYVDLHFSSPGGYVESGMGVVNWMEQGRANGITYRCYVEGLAASAAFLVLTGCDERFATRGSMFLVHEMWMPVNPSQIVPTVDPVLLQAMTEANTLQGYLNSYQAERLRINWSKIERWYSEEYLFNTYELVDMAPGFISIGTK